MDIDKNHPWVKQQIKSAYLKSFIFSLIVSLLFAATTFPHLNYFDYIFIFFLSLCFAFSWFSHNVRQYLEPYKRHKKYSTIDSINMSNGYPPGLGAVMPPPLSQK